MKSDLKVEPYRLHVYVENRKRKMFVGELSYNIDKDKYKFVYDKTYIKSKNAIPLGNELDLFKPTHISSKGKLFPSFLDRIPDKENPAYKDYCRSQGISLDETNFIILLGSIGRKGPSSFIFEKIYKTDFSADKIKKFRSKLKITQHDFSKALGVSKITLQRIEAGISKDANVLKLLEIYLTFPEVAVWQLQQTGSAINTRELYKLMGYFTESSR